jgi:hypothetical protein
MVESPLKGSECWDKLRAEDAIRAAARTFGDECRSRNFLPTLDSLPLNDDRTENGKVYKLAKYLQVVKTN